MAFTDQSSAAEPSTMADPVFELSSAFVDEFAVLSPIQATMTGIPGEHAGWDDLSPTGAARMLAFLIGYRTRLEALAPTSDQWARVARRVMSDFLEERIANYETLDFLSDINHIESPFQHVRMVFDLMDSATTAGFAVIARRLLVIDQALAGYRATLSEGMKRGHVAARRQVRSVIEQARVHAGPGSSFLALLDTADAVIAAAHAPPASLRADLARGIEHARLSFGAFADFLEAEYLPAATERDPFGEERYVRSAKRFLGMDLDPRETYEWGFREIATIEAAMLALADGVKSGATIAEAVKLLEVDPAEMVASSSDFLDLMRQRQERALRELMGSHFDVPEPIRTIEVKLAPPGSPLGAYYVPPSEDFSRPGTVYYAPAPGKSFTLFTEISTAYHEGFPGHHLQCGLQVYFKGRLSRLHRMLVCCSGYAEGWALYAEQLMDELGYYERPSFVLGMLLAKLFRACRIVVDIGMHLELPIPPSFSFHPGETWSYELGVEFMHQRAFLDAPFAESETLRYLGWPGQAISYKVGERVILELRAETKARLGERFELRAFHEAVLNAGSVGLAHLRDIVLESLPS